MWRLGHRVISPAMSAGLQIVPSVRSDPASPNFVFAPSPSDPNTIIRLFANPSTIQTMLRDARNSAIGQYAGLVHGRFVVRSEAGEETVGGTAGLMKAVALFRGIKRPRLQGGLDGKVFVYVTNPGVDFVWPERVRSGTEHGPTRMKPPLNSVFTTFVVFDEDSIAAEKAAMAARGGGPVHGIIHNWEWTLASPAEPRFPDEFATRYEEKVWAR